MQKLIKENQIIIFNVFFRISPKFKLIIKLKLKFVATKKTPIIEIKTENS